MVKKVSDKKLRREIEISEGVEPALEGDYIIMKKDSNELKRKIGTGVNAKIEGNKILLGIKRDRREEKRTLGTPAGHIKNMIKGLVEGFEYELEICNVHFPMTVDFDNGKKEFIVKNLLGEKIPRTLKSSDKVEVEINAPKILLKSHDIELVGQVAGDLEKITRVKNRDRNKFQDGIFITKKPGREFL